MCFVIIFNGGFLPMEKLSRTKKYADLRSRLESDRETQIKSDSLSGFENKVNTLEQNIKKEAAHNIVSNVTPIKTISETKEVKPTNDSPSLDLFDDSLDSLLKELGETVTKIEPAKEPIKEEPVKTEKEEPKEEPKEEIKDDNVETDLFPWFKDTQVEEPVKTEEVKESVEPIKATPSSASDDYIDDTFKEVNDYIKSKGLLTADEVSNTILEEIRAKDKTEESTLNREPALSLEPEEEPKLTEEQEASLKQKKLDETVTMEIRDVLNALNIEEAEEEPVKTAETKEVEEPSKTEEEADGFKADDIRALFANDETETVKETETEEAKETKKSEAIETEETKEAESIETEEAKEEVSDSASELLGQYFNDDDDATSDNTMVFYPEEHHAIAQTLESEDKDTETNTSLLNETTVLQLDENEEEEEAAPNRILNIILTVLIIALIAVIGFIGYGLLKTQGII